MRRRLGNRLGLYRKVNLSGQPFPDRLRTRDGPPASEKLLEIASRQLGGLLPQTDQQFGAAAIGEQGAHFGSL